LAGWIEKTIGRAPVGVTPLGQSLPLSWSTPSCLKAYGEIGWLHACVARISTAVAEAEPHLYRGKGKAREEVTSHPLLDVLNHMTPFHTRQEAFELEQTYMELTGEFAMLIFRDQGGSVRELWPVSPQLLSVVPHPTEYLTGWVYTTSSGEKVPMDKRDVLFIRTPNPASQYRGQGAVQAIITDLESEKAAAQWNRNYFVNGASPGEVLEIPGTLSQEQYERLSQQWKQSHQGVANAHKVAILQGGAKMVTPRVSIRDMDYAKLRQANRDIILGAFGMSPHMLGQEESSNRASAESSEYVFARWLISPRLKRLAGKITEFLLPQFPRSEGLTFEFADPTPEDSAMRLQRAQQGFTGGFLTRNEARSLVHQDSIGKVGDVFFMPITVVPEPAGRGRR
jgi:HK97 family phage portal protein